MSRKTFALLEGGKNQLTHVSTKSYWDEIADSSEFKELMKRKKRFTIISTIFFCLYYFALPIFAGYFNFLNVKVWGSINAVYLFAISQFFMAWILAIIYVRHANRLDHIVEEIVKQKARKLS